MDYRKFYTPYKIASILVDEISIPIPQKIIDICCGSCNLLFAAQKRWATAQLYGVDLFEHSTLEHVIFEKKDGRQFAIEHPGEFSLVVANPPFSYIENKKQFPDLFVNEFKEVSTSRLEVEMLIANLRLLNPNGVLLVILPSSFVEGETYKSFRKIIANNYYIESIIKLDENTFGSSQIATYALIIRNEQQNRRHAKSSVFNGTTVSFISNILSENLADGQWCPDSQCNYNISLEIKRGNISSSSFTEKGQPILHTSKFSHDWKPSVRYISENTTSTVTVESGDIIVSRIGKSAGQWCLYTGATIAISDCLYCIKDSDHKLFDKIKGKRFNRNLRGVATRYVTIADISSWINSI